MSKSSLVSIIIPTYNSGEYISALLQSAKEQTYKEVEIVIVDNNSKDSTKEIAKLFTKQVFNKGPERSAQRNYGVKKSKGEYLLVLDSDMVLTKKVVEECVSKMKKNEELRAIVIGEESFGEGFWAQCKVLERSFYRGVSWMEAARFFRREVFEEMGGYNEKNTGTEDYDLPQRIEEKYGERSIGRINSLLLHNEQKISLWKTCKKKFYYAQRLRVYHSVPANLGKFKKQASILHRFGLFFSDPVKLFRNPIVGIGMLFMKISEFVFGGAGFIYGILTKK